MESKKIFSKTYYLLSKDQKKNFFLMIFLLLIAGIVEMFSVGMIVPFASVLLNQESNTFNLLMHNLENFFGLSIENNEMIVYGLGIFLTIFFLKLIFMSFLIYFKNYFLFSVRNSISEKIFSIYLTKPYSFFVSQNSSKLILNCKYEVDFYLTNILQTTIELFTELIIMTSLLILILILKPLISTILIFTFLVFIILYQFVLKRKTLRWGTEREYTDKEINKLLIQSFGAIKDVILKFKQNFFLIKFKKFLKQNSIVSVRQLTSTEIPRFLMEFLAIVFFVLISIVFSKTGQNFLEMIPYLGLYAAVAFKVLPAINRILASIQRIRYGIPSSEILYNEIFNYNKIGNQNQDQSRNIINSNNKIFKSSIQIKNVNYKYDEKFEDTLKNINLEIKKGEIVGIKGESGAGKSTLVNLISTLENNYNGSILIDGEDIRNIEDQWKSIIGYVPQNTFVFDDTIMSNIAFGIDEDDIDVERLNKVMKISQIYEFVYSLRDNIKTIIGERGVKFSGGQIQRLAIARALYTDPKFLILDEATNALDKENEINIIESLIKLKNDLTILIISHKNTLWNYTNKLYTIENRTLKKISNER